MTLILLATGLGAVYGVWLANQPMKRTAQHGVAVRAWDRLSATVVGAIIYGFVGWWIGFAVYVVLKGLDAVSV